MNWFETIVACIFVLAAFTLTYQAGKCDLLNVMCLMFAKKAKELEEADREE